MSSAGPQSIAEIYLGTDPGANKELYDGWAQKYTVDVDNWGYDAPARVAGLKRVAEQWLRRSVDKTLQCSDWDARPLSAAQLQYAATDAAVLLDLADAMMRPVDAAT